MAFHVVCDVCQQTRKAVLAKELKNLKDEYVCPVCSKKILSFEKRMESILRRAHQEIDVLGRGHKDLLIAAIKDHVSDVDDKQPG